MSYFKQSKLNLYKIGFYYKFSWLFGVKRSFLYSKDWTGKGKKIMLAQWAWSDFFLILYIMKQWTSIHIIGRSNENVGPRKLRDKFEVFFYLCSGSNVFDFLLYQLGVCKVIFLWIYDYSSYTPKRVLMCQILVNFLKSINHFSKGLADIRLCNQITAILFR